MWNMHSLANFEIYIPKESEVKTIPLWTLPNPILRRIGLNRPDGDGSTNLLDSPKATWISPAVIREKGTPTCNHAGVAAKESMTSSLMEKKKERGTVQGPFQMYFVVSNCTAYRVLREFLPAIEISRQPTHTSKLPHGSAPGTHQDAVIIYSGHIYLSIRMPKLVRGRGQTQKSKPNEPALATQPLLSQPASPDPEDSEFVAEKGSLKRRCLTRKAQVILPKMSPEDLKSLVAKTQVLSTRESPDPKRPKHTGSETNAEQQTLHFGTHETHQAQVTLPRTSSEDTKSLVAKLATLIRSSTRECRDPKLKLFNDTGSKRICDGSKDDIETESQDEDQSTDQEADAPSSNSGLINKPEGEDPSEEQAVEQVTNDSGHDDGLPIDSDEGLQVDSDEGLQVDSDDGLQVDSDDGLQVDSDELHSEFDVAEECPLVPTFSSNPVQHQGSDFEQSDQELTEDSVEPPLVPTFSSNPVQHQDFDFEQSDQEVTKGSVEFPLVPTFTSNPVQHQDSDFEQSEQELTEDSVEPPLVPTFFSNPVQHQDFDFDQSDQEVTEDSVEFPLVPTFTSNPVQHQDFDFEQLAQEEKIERMKALLREREAALSKLCP